MNEASAATGQLSTADCAQMLRLQAEMNERIHPAWREQGYSWFRAIWIECAELVGHTGYQWWRSEQPNQAQLQLEVVDIWHFGLSALMEQRSADELAPWLAQCFAKWTATSDASMDVTQCAEALAAAVLQRQDFDMESFVDLLTAAALSPVALHRRYVGKNVLNRFRQDQGYREGSYHKMWNGLEDNEHLQQIIDQLPVGDEADMGAAFGGFIYAELERRYSALFGDSTQ